MISIYKKELRSYFTNMTGYVAIALILVMAGIFIKITSFDSHLAQMEFALPTISIILMLAVPIVTMRSFAEERHQHTDRLLYTLPLSTAKIVLGKYLAMMTVLAVPTVVIGMIPFVLKAYGKVDLFASYAALFTFFLLIAAMTAIGMFMSALTESQVIAAVLGSGALILCYFAEVLTGVIPKTELASYLSFAVLAVLAAVIVYQFVRNYWVAFAVGIALEAAVLLIYLLEPSLFLGLIQKTVGMIALFRLFSDAVNSQLLDLSVVVYYLSISVFFSFLTMQVVEKRRYS